MIKWKNTFLVLSLAELFIGLSNAKENAFFYLGLPIGTILFGLFLIMQMLEQESALYDEQNRASESLRPCCGRRQSQSRIFKEVAHHPGPAMANPH